MKMACRHIKSLFFANLNNQFMWFTFMKAGWRSLTTKLLGKWFGELKFKATAKGAASSAADLGLSDNPDCRLAKRAGFWTAS